MKRSEVKDCYKWNLDSVMRAEEWEKAFASLSENKNALSKYVGKDVSNLKKDIGGFKETYRSYADVYDGENSDLVYITEDGKVVKLALKSSAKNKGYTFYGIRLGATKSTFESAVKKQGFSISEKSNNSLSYDKSGKNFILVVEAKFDSKGTITALEMHDEYCYYWEWGG